MRFSSCLRVLPGLFLLLFSVACGSSSKSGNCKNECSAEGATSCAGDQVRTCHKDSNGCFKLSTAACPSGETCQGSACTCTTQCGGTCCAAGAACIDGACCDTPCGSTCGCEAPQVCSVNAAGAKQCAFPCSLSGSCPDGCCLLQPDGSGACLAAPASSTAPVCKCNSSFDCASLPDASACAPGSSQGVGGPNVCTPPDGSAGHGCNISTCANGYECWLFGGNPFCTNACDSDAECPTGSCCRKDPDAFCNVQGGVCAKTGGCMACPAH